MRKLEKKQSFLTTFPKYVRWLANNLTKSSYKELSIANMVTDKILNVIKNRGYAEAIRYTKDLRLKFLKFILSINEETFSTREKSRLPRILRPVARMVLEQKSYPFIRLIFSVLYLTRSIRLEGDISTSTIETHPTYSRDVSDLDEDIKSFLKIIGVNSLHLGKVPKTLKFKEFHMTSKSGPNGHALWTSFRDIMALTDQQKESIRIIGGDRLSDLMVKFSGLYQRIPAFFEQYATRKGRLLTRKLVKINDKEGKTREVAIGDYYSQAALLPLHKYLMRTLQRINQDCTQNQTKLFYTLEKSIKSSYHSIDLTAFTDRFPIEINHRIFNIWFGQEFADSWKHLMIGEPFDYQGKSIYYRCGNPMGLYSSWASTTLSHHFLLYLAAKRCRLNWKRSRYMLLGDDIVISNDRLAQAYLEILSEWGIEFNKSKTHTSENGFEFAKQIRLHSQNVSPFPLSALYERRREKISTLGIILNEVRMKNWNSDLKSVVKSYYIEVFRWPRPRFRAFEPIINMVISLLDYLQGNDPIGKGMAKAIRIYVRSITGMKGGWKLLSKKDRRLFTHWIVTKTVQTLYLDSRERIVSKSTGGSLGELATLMVMHITSLRDGGADCFDLIESVPFLQVYGRAEEVFLKSYDNLYDYGLGSSNEQLRRDLGKVDIPLSDQGFYVRHRDVLIVQAMRASKILTNLLSTTTEVVAYNGQLRIPLPWSDYLKKSKQ